MQSAASELQAVLLPRYGEGQILGPGQLVPIWDIAAWARTSVPFELQGYFATLSNNAFVCSSRDQKVDALEDIVVLEESGRMGTDLSQQRELASASRAVLSDVGGVVTIRPDLIPIGMIPSVDRMGLGGPSIEIQSATALDFHRMSRSLSRTTEAPPQICFFASLANGPALGWDVTAEEQTTVIALPGLPASFYAAQDTEMGLVKADDPHGDQFRTAMLSAVCSMLKGLDIRAGFIYAGFEMGATPAEERHWDMNDIGNGLEMPLYAMPWVDQPLHALNPGARASAQAMLRGDYRRPPMARATLFSRR